MRLSSLRFGVGAMAAASVNCARPIIAVIASGGNHPALARLPASLSESVELVRVGETPAEIEAQANELGRCTGLLWIPTAGWGTIDLIVAPHLLPS